MKKLKDISTIPPETFSKKECEKELNAFHKRLFELQNVFYADSRFALLIIFQGIDTAGKDGTIRHVMTSMNPSGVLVKSFKQPTEEEMKHDFLWRIYPHFPANGMLEVFNRSYYEDILVPSIEKKNFITGVN
jgi:polyphosphate kinase 2 (PPK2 family)